MGNQSNEFNTVRRKKDVERKVSCGILKIESMFARIERIVRI